MSESESVSKRKKPRGDAPGGGSDAGTEKASKLRKDMDDLLEEIDSVLEENAEEFVKNYVQKGGE